MTPARQSSGSRFLYAPFEVTEARIEANERVLEARWSALTHRLQGIELALERLERRLWLAVFGVLSVVLAQGVSALLASAP
ncbi:MAG: hypothetical protein AAGF88_08665 [Pseudomonadota bacterium]